MQARLRSTQCLPESMRSAYQVKVSELKKSFELQDEAATRQLGARLATYLRAGDVVLMRGELGAGKTSLARGAISALSQAEEVPSPTYTLVQTYESDKFDIWHFDLYRLDDPADVWELGIEEAVDEGVSLIEWPERIESLLNGSELTIKINFNDKGRTAIFTGYAGWKERLNGL